jgi:hypothetical protein
VAKSSSLPTLPKIPGLGKPQRLPTLKRFAVHPTGPRHLHLGQRPTRIGIGPGEPPPGFVISTAHNSKTEWLVYWAIATLLDDPHDPRQPPFTGSRLGNWTVQVMEDGGRVSGGSVTDFQVKTPTGWIGIRVDTERWHTMAAPNQQLKDLFLKTHVKALQKVITIYEQHFIEDSGPQGTGQAVCRVVALALRGIELANPIRAGTARRTRPI